MSATLKVTGHSYRRIVLTPGFIISVLMAPIIVLVSALIPVLAEKTSPVRYLTVVDQTGGFEQEVYASYDRKWRYETLLQWDTHVGALSIRSPGLVDQLPDYLQPGDINRSRIDRFFNAGGIENANRALEALGQGGLKFSPPDRKLFVVKSPVSAESGSLEEIALALTPWLEGDRTVDGPAGPRPIHGAALIRNGEETPELQYWSEEVTSLDIPQRVERVILKVLEEKEWERLGVPSTDVERISELEIKTGEYKPGAEDGDSEVEIADIFQRFMPAILAYILFFSIFSGGGLLLTSVIEEKSNKIAEVLLSSVTAQQLMMGKLMGQGLATLTMYGVWLALSFGILFAFAPQIVPVGLDILMADNLLPWFFIYFVLGYILFASIFMAVGAISPTLQDAQSYLTPLTLILLLPIPLIINVVQDPNGLIASVLTFIPLYAPYALLIRVGSEPPLWELYGGTVLLIISAIFMVWLMGRIFRASLLSGGEPPKLKDIFVLMKG